MRQLQIITFLFTITLFIFSCRKFDNLSYNEVEFTTSRNFIKVHYPPENDTIRFKHNIANGRVLATITRDGKYNTYEPFSNDVLTLVDETDSFIVVLAKDLPTSSSSEYLNLHLVDDFQTIAESENIYINDTIHSVAITERSSRIYFRTNGGYHSINPDGTDYLLNLSDYQYDNFSVSSDGSMFNLRDDDNEIAYTTFGEVKSGVNLPGMKPTFTRTDNSMQRGYVYDDYKIYFENSDFQVSPKKGYRVKNFSFTNVNNEITVAYTLRYYYDTFEYMDWIVVASELSGTLFERQMRLATGVQIAKDAKTVVWSEFNLDTKQFELRKLNLSSMDTLTLDTSPESLPIEEVALSSTADTVAYIKDTDPDNNKTTSDIFLITSNGTSTPRNLTNTPNQSEYYIDWN